MEGSKIERKGALGGVSSPNVVPSQANTRRQKRARVGRKLTYGVPKESQQYQKKVLTALDERIISPPLTGFEGKQEEDSSSPPMPTQPPTPDHPWRFGLPAAVDAASSANTLSDGLRGPTTLSAPQQRLRYRPRPVSVEYVPPPPVNVVVVNGPTRAPDVTPDEVTDGEPDSFNRMCVWGNFDHFNDPNNPPDFFSEEERDYWLRRNHIRPGSNVYHIIAMREHNRLLNMLAQEARFVHFTPMGYQRFLPNEKWTPLQSFYRIPFVYCNPEVFDVVQFLFERTNPVVSMHSYTVNFASLVRRIRHQFDLSNPDYLVNVDEDLVGEVEKRTEWKFFGIVWRRGLTASERSAKLQSYAMFPYRADSRRGQELLLHKIHDAIRRVDPAVLSAFRAGLGQVNDRAALNNLVYSAVRTVSTQTLVLIEKFLKNEDGVELTSFGRECLDSIGRTYDNDQIVNLRFLTKVVSADVMNLDGIVALSMKPARSSWDAFKQFFTWKDEEWIWRNISSPLDQKFLED